MILIESPDFSKNTLKNFDLLSYFDLNDEQKEAYNEFVKIVTNDDDIIGRNKPSFNNNNHYVQDFIDKNLWHYHCGLVIEKTQHKPNNYNKKGCVKYWLPQNINKYSQTLISLENKDGLVCDFLIHYTISEEFIFIYCASYHGKWEVIAKET